MKSWMKRIIVLTLVVSMLLGSNVVLRAEDEPVKIFTEELEPVPWPDEYGATEDIVGRNDIQPVNPWIGNAEEERRLQRAWDEAVENYKDYQINNTNSTFYDIAGDWANKEFGEIAKEEAAKIFGDWAGPVAEFVDACRKIAENVTKAANYRSEHEHGIFKWIDYACEWYSVICNTFTDIADVINADVLTLPVQLMNYAVSFARDFFNMPEVVETMNNSNPWFMQILDWLFDLLEDPDGTIKRTLDPANLFKWCIRMVEWINCYKPNIYIYGEEGTELSVTFDTPQLLTTTIPEYNDTWDVALEEDGQLTVDGLSDFDFLFYESVTLPELLQDESGFVINADTREEQFREIMTEYGFNETETDDFVEFWMEKLEENVDYVMYPQLTEAVDIAMPITVEAEEEFDSYYRIWFYFVNVAEVDMAAVSEPEIVPVEHDGFTLIEWGGIVE